MKKTLLLLMITVGIYVTTNAQILNNDFENWANGSPVDWHAYNQPDNIAITQTTDAFSGSYAVKGTVVETTDGKGFIPALAAGSDAKGFPINSRVASLQGWYKFFPDSGDAFMISVAVYKNGKSFGFGGLYSTQSQSGYTEFSIPILYNSTEVPDTIQILVLIAGTNAHIGSTYYLDDLSLGTATDVNGESAETPFIYSLKQNYPNPFNPSTVIRYSLSEPGFVRLKVFNVLGELVRTLVNENLEAGEYSVPFNAAGLPSGIYVYRLEAGNFTSEKKLVLLK